MDNKTISRPPATAADRKVAKIKLRYGLMAEIHLKPPPPPPQPPPAWAQTPPNRNPYQTY